MILRISISSDGTVTFPSEVLNDFPGIYGVVSADGVKIFGVCPSEFVEKYQRIVVVGDNVFYSTDGLDRAKIGETSVLYTPIVTDKHIDLIARCHTITTVTNESSDLFDQIETLKIDEYWRDIVLIAIDSIKDGEFDNAIFIENLEDFYSLANVNSNAVALIRDFFLKEYVVDLMKEASTIDLSSNAETVVQKAKDLAGSLAERDKFDVVFWSNGGRNHITNNGSDISFPEFTVDADDFIIRRCLGDKNTISHDTLVRYKDSIPQEVAENIHIVSGFLARRDIVVDYDDGTPVITLPDTKFPGQWNTYSPDYAYGVILAALVKVIGEPRIVDNDGNVIYEPYYSCNETTGPEMYGKEGGLLHTPNAIVVIASHLLNKSGNETLLKLSSVANIVGNVMCVYDDIRLRVECGAFRGPSYDEYNQAHKLVGGFENLRFFEYYDPNGVIRMKLHDGTITTLSGGYITDAAKCATAIISATEVDVGDAFPFSGYDGAASIADEVEKAMRQGISFNQNGVVYSGNTVVGDYDFSTEQILLMFDHNIEVFDFDLAYTSSNQDQFAYVIGNMIEEGAMFREKDNPAVEKLFYRYYQTIAPSDSLLAAGIGTNIWLDHILINGVNPRDRDALFNALFENDSVEIVPAGGDSIRQLDIQIMHAFVASYKETYKYIIPFAAVGAQPFERDYPNDVAKGIFLDNFYVLSSRIKDYWDGQSITFKTAPGGFDDGEVTFSKDASPSGTDWVWSGQNYETTITLSHNGSVSVNCDRDDISWSTDEITVDYTVVGCFSSDAGNTKNKYDALTMEMLSSASVDSCGDTIDQIERPTPTWGIRRVIYTLSQGNNGAIVVAYKVLDEDDNDITDEVKTFTVGDHFFVIGE